MKFDILSAGIPIGYCILPGSSLSCLPYLQRLHCVVFFKVMHGCVFTTLDPFKASISNLSDGREDYWFTAVSNCQHLLFAQDVVLGDFICLA